MKGILTLLGCILCQSVLGQFGIITDKDGFVYIRKSPKISNNIIDTLANGQIVFCMEREGDWLPIDYNLKKQNNSGYVHKSRVVLIENYEKIVCNKLSDSIIEFKRDTIKLIITKTKFIAQKNKLEYHKVNGLKGKEALLVKINGKEIWGTDGNVPKIQYKQFILTLAKDTIQLPMENLFEPNFNFMKVNIDGRSKTIYISTLNGDGAGGYAALWIIENGKFKQRIVTIPF